MSSWSLVIPEHFPQLAVRADSQGGKGPNYVLENDYRYKHAVVFAWQSLFHNLKTDILKSTLPVVYKMKCRVEAEKNKEDQWELVINLDKP